VDFPTTSNFSVCDIQCKGLKLLLTFIGDETAGNPGTFVHTLLYSNPSMSSNSSFPVLVRPFPAWSSSFVSQIATQLKPGGKEGVKLYDHHKPRNIVLQ